MMKWRGNTRRISAIFMKTWRNLLKIISQIRVIFETRSSFQMKRIINMMSLWLCISKRISSLRSKVLRLGITSLYFQVEASTTNALGVSKCNSSTLCFKPFNILVYFLPIPQQGGTSRENWVTMYWFAILLRIFFYWSFVIDYDYVWHCMTY